MTNSENDEPGQSKMERAWLAGHAHAWTQVWTLLEDLGVADIVERLWLAGY